MNRRSEKLDHYINKHVKITFFNGRVAVGVLGWNEHLEPLMITPERYYLKSSNGVYISFRKNCVKSINDISNDKESR